MPAEPPALTTEYVRSKVVDYAGTEFRTHGQPVPAWLAPTLKTLRDLSQLPKDWDGYGADQIHEQIPFRALGVLGEVMDFDSPAPSVVPLSDGGIQLEWHRHGRNLEIEFPTDAAPNFFYYEDSGGDEAEGQVSRSYDQIQMYLSSLK